MVYYSYKLATEKGGNLESRSKATQHRTETTKIRRSGRGPRSIKILPIQEGNMAMMYADEDDFWNCPQHPSRRRRIGICSTCLRERLNTLCPDCANQRPCGCSSASTSSSSSSSSSFSRFFSASGRHSGVGSVGRVSNLIESEPSFRRSRSVAVPFLRSRSKFVGDMESGDRMERESSGAKSSRMTAFFGMFRRDRSRRSGVGFDETSCSGDDSRSVVDVAESATEAQRVKMMRKSRSVAVTSYLAGSDVRPAGKASRGWYFPSPIKAFKQSKVSKAVAQEHSPLPRG